MVAIKPECAKCVGIEIIFFIEVREQWPVSFNWKLIRQEIRVFFDFIAHLTLFQNCRWMLRGD
jgi:hypothetical protein